MSSTLPRVGYSIVWQTVVVVCLQATPLYKEISCHFCNCKSLMFMRHGSCKQRYSECLERYFHAKNICMQTIKVTWAARIEHRQHNRTLPLTSNCPLPVHKEYCSQSYYSNQYLVLVGLPSALDTAGCVIATPSGLRQRPLHMQPDAWSMKITFLYTMSGEKRATLLWT